MPALTPTAALPYPVPTDPPDVAGDMKRLAEAVDTYVSTHTSKPVGEIFTFWDMGTGYPAGALVCDGSTFSPTSYPLLSAHLGGNQLPDLRGKFLMGANTTFAVRTSGGFSNAITVAHDHADGVHTHPMLHNHTASSIAETADHAHGVNINSSTHGNHNHGVAPGMGGVGMVITGIFGAGGLAGAGTNSLITSTGFYPDGEHYHNVSGATGGRSAAHVHAITVDNSTVATGNSSDTVRTGTTGDSGLNRNLPPFTAITYLMQAR